MTEEKLYAHANNCKRIVVLIEENIENTFKDALPERDQHKLVLDDVKFAFLDVGKTVMGYLDEKMFRDVEPAFKELFSKKWYSVDKKDQPMQQIIATFKDYFAEIQALVLADFLPPLVSIFIFTNY